MNNIFAPASNNVPLGAQLAIAQPAPAPGTLGAQLGMGASPVAPQPPVSMEHLNPLDNYQATATQGTEVSQKRFFLEYVNIQETPEYLDHYNRNYTPVARTESEYTNSIQDLILDVARANGAPAASVIAPHATNIFGLNMAAGPQNQTFIPGGWRHKRAKFLMLVREEDIQFGKTRMTYINGFTDHFGVTKINGRTTIDENMVFYINSLVTLAQEKHVTPQGAQTFWNVVQASQLVDGQLVGVDVTTNSVQNVHMLRPTDVITRLSEQSDHELGVSSWMTSNGTNTTLGGVVSHFNNMSNNMPTSYLGRLLAPALKGAGGLSSRPGLGGLASSMFDLANSGEFTIANCPFLRYMSRTLGRPLVTSFTLGQLARLDPTIGQRTKHFEVDQASYMNINAMSLDSTPWNYAGIETEVATKLLAVIPSLMWENFATNASFSITNATPGHVPVISWDFLQFVTPTGLPAFHQKLEQALLHTVLQDITRANQLVIAARIFVEVNGEIRMSISYEGGPEMHFTSPAFGCGILNPIHTNDQKTADSIIQGFGMMVDGVVALRNESRNPISTATSFNF